MRYNIIYFFLLLGCQNSFIRHDNTIITQDTINEFIVNHDYVLERIKSKDPFKNDTIMFNNFYEYIEFIPDLNLNDNLKTPEISFEIGAMLNKCNYGPEDSSCPISKIVKSNFVAIIYSAPVQGELHFLVTYTRSGKKIDEINVYNFDGYDTLDTTYRKEEKCECRIDNDLNIHYKHYASLLIKNDKSKTNIKDTIILNDYSEYYAKIDNFGRINKK